VVLVHKKRNTSKIEHYRPISLSNTIYKMLARIIQQRLANGIDHALQETQYGFRAKEFTNETIHLIRMVMELTERAGEKLGLILINWEKAFDRISHKGLTTALERVGVQRKYVAIIRNIYENAFSMVQIEGGNSKWYKQESVIRQGCPLSPYLFLIVMKVIFAEVHKDLSKTNKRALNRHPGCTMDDVLYADDTILISKSLAELETLLQEIERGAGKCGMKLNKGKCELLKMGNHGRRRNVRFLDGTHVAEVNEVKYLGCLLHDRTDGARELRKRKGDVMLVWKRLDKFWRLANCDEQENIRVFQALLKAR